MCENIQPVSIYLGSFPSRKSIIISLVRLILLPDPGFCPVLPTVPWRALHGQRSGIIAVYVTEKSKKQGTAEGPGLALVVAEIFDLQSHFFHHFSVNSLLNCFSDFCKACNESVAFESTSFIFGQDDFISVCDPYNNCRTQNRIFLIAAGRHSIIRSFWL